MNQGQTMKTSVIDVRDMLSVLSVVGVEQRIGEVPGVESVTVNFAAGNATVRFDETRLDIAGIRSGVRQRAHDATAATAASAGGTDDDPQAPSAQPPTPQPDATKTATAAVAATDATTPEPPESAPQSAPAAEDEPPRKG